MGNECEATVVFVKEHGVLGVVTAEFNLGCVVKWYLDGIEFEVFLLQDEYINYRHGEIGGMDV
jgi:hypothetical protein